ncbi:unnamed protein product [Cyprideis torosa]|uniref:Uncharacterized protein n=1 Tax=Cyprideis torosa TaxID=163714 RepID=A0A7R8W9E9_9CRUS|nr:unnamed protein product [Cyprideis torosa]CAG0888451.1 unnamed protein product [Cyprideis torosa]
MEAAGRARAFRRRASSLSEARWPFEEGPALCRRPAFPPSRENFRKALELMQRSLGGAPVALPPSDPTPQPRQQNGASQPLGLTVTGSNVPAAFKELLERRCQEKGIDFYPIPGKFKEAKQVFTCGRFQIYIDRSVIFVLESPSKWVPWSLSRLVDSA